MHRSNGAPIPTGDRRKESGSSMKLIEMLEAGRCSFHLGNRYKDTNITHSINKALDMCTLRLTTWLKWCEEMSSVI